jgi:putative ATP-dependent endonuclease of OLD family
LRPLLDVVSSEIDHDQLVGLADGVFTATRAVAETAEVKSLVDTINNRLIAMVGSGHAVEAALGFSPTNHERLLRALRLFIDGGAREIASDLALPD